ncbi:SDR family NAD(P)-dependent oxidoreductase [Nostoc sp. 'Peltigera malacea cyanobiont' DB3992]|uniref:SDR family NAD(P)-dependent oxidoreductase n=1 Tax=Nostoc sp. 'Peltigera malacea cyanobiont' DB3992 TaxID=1206980 RepID=UPI000C0445E2|nr:glucose 1-dehydrogenase [Nostoc sp. 'Peltigera malacea cyanobiont' DB3992]PHM06750.1 short-chain dehydrogenase [Nostoc sp. 'Peltigera malacea cyanobiont' DB3992]
MTISPVQILSPPAVIDDPSRSKTTTSKLANKIALVTGASKGIGASIAKHLGAAGATVIVNYATSQSGADKIVADITADGGQATAIQGDFSKLEDITRTFAQIKQTHGKLDILVNNAGVYSFGAIEQVTPEEFYRQFNLNVLGLLLAIKEAIPLMGTEGGSVINIGSAVGSMPPANSAIYSATKAAVDSLTVSLSKEFGSRKIRVNSLNPGFVATEGQQGFLEGDVYDMAIKSTPLGRVGQPEDIGPIAVFLASEDSHWLTGQRILATGGQTW